MRRIAASRGAKVLAGEAAIVNGKSATQVYGGMGFTWEVDVHLYLKRAWVLDTHFGSGDATPTRCRGGGRGSEHPLPDATVRSMTRPQTTVLEALAERLATDPDGPYLDFSRRRSGLQYTARQMDAESNRLGERALRSGSVAPIGSQPCSTTGPNRWCRSSPR